MIAQNLIKFDVEPLISEDNGHNALNRMMEYNMEMFPVVDTNNVFQGMVARLDVEDLPNKDHLIGDMNIGNDRCVVKHFDHIFEVVKKLLEYKTPMLAVADENGKFIGTVDAHCVLDSFQQFNIFTDPGGIIVLEVNSVHYSMTEISQIVESNQASILGMLLNAQPNSKRMLVTLKVSKIDLKDILATFERYDYIIQASYEEGESVDFLQERLESLMNYLNI